MKRSTIVFIVYLFVTTVIWIFFVMDNLTLRVLLWLSMVIGSYLIGRFL